MSSKPFFDVDPIGTCYNERKNLYRVELGGVVYCWAHDEAYPCGRCPINRIQPADPQPRMIREEYLIASVKLVAQRGTCLRAKVGAIIERDGRIISTGYNGSTSGEPHCLDVGCLMEDGHCIRTVHAEANAIAFAARHGISVEGATLWTFGWKDGCCKTCKKLALSAGIKEIKEIPL